MLEDYPNTIQQMKHEEEKSAVSLKTVESVTEAKATGEAKVATKTAVVEKAVVKKDKTTNGAVQALPQVSKTTQFNSPVYGKCKIYSVKERNYVHWQERDTKRWVALLCSAAPNHRWQCRYLRDILIEGHSKQSIATVIGNLKSGNIAPGEDADAPDV